MTVSDVDLNDIWRVGVQGYTSVETARLAAKNNSLASEGVPQGSGVPRGQASSAPSFMGVNPLMIGIGAIGLIGAVLLIKG